MGVRRSNTLLVFSNLATCTGKLSFDGKLPNLLFRISPDASSLLHIPICYQNVHLSLPSSDARLENSVSPRLYGLSTSFTKTSKLTDSSLPAVDALAVLERGAAATEHKDST